MASDYHARIMNIPANGKEMDSTAYRMGHRDARHAAAEIALEAEAEVERLNALLDSVYARERCRVQERDDALANQLLAYEDIYDEYGEKCERVGELRAILDRVLDANATREHESMPQEEWDALMLEAKDTLSGEGGKS